MAPENATTEERVAVLKRLRSMLERQRTRFQRYLSLLELQQAAINDGDLGALDDRLAAERELLEDLKAVHRVIVPLRDLIHSRGIEITADVAQLDASVEKLRVRVTEHHTRNRELLSKATRELSERIDSIDLPRRPFRVYRPNDAAGGLIDVVW